MITEEDRKQLEALKDKPETEEELEQMGKVDERRITLVDHKNHEFDFIILDEYLIDDRDYLALVSVDEDDDMGEGDDPGEMNDITVVRKFVEEEGIAIQAVTDPDELLEVSRLINKNYGHLVKKES